MHKLPPLSRKTPYIDIDPRIFGHPLATEIDWTPLEQGGNFIKTQRRYQPSPTRMGFKAARRAWVYNGLVVLLGLITFVGPFIREESSPLWLHLAGLGFMALGVGLWIKADQRRIFDKELGYYFRGKTFKKESSTYPSIPLHDIVALQILMEHVKGGKSDYKSYELNLVLKDSKRIMVLDHADKDQIKEDAAQLSAFLNIPVWNYEDAIVTRHS